MDMRLFLQMSLKEKLLNALYYIEGNIIWLLTSFAIKKYIRRKQSCLPCFEQGSCIHCGCDFNRMAVSSKPCKNMNNENTGS